MFLTEIVYGSIAIPLPLDDSKKPPNTAKDHTHQWTVYVRGVDGADITYMIKKVQFKLHETYSQSLRTIEAPNPFEVTETGWGEFEVTIKLFFTPESNEKPQSCYHQLKLHPYGDDAEGVRERREPVISQQYEEIVFNEPSEAFYDILTSGPPQQHARGKGASKISKPKKGSERTAEIPQTETPDNPYSLRTELKELDRLKEAQKQVEVLLSETNAKLQEQEKELEELRKTEGGPTKTK